MNNDITDRIITENIIAGGWNYSRIIRRGQALRLTDIEGGGNVSAMFYNAANFSERFNLGDTLKIQHICRLTRNCCIYSDMGRILMSVPEDTCGWHDMLCGCAHAALIEKKFGKKEYQEAHNDFYRNGYDSLLVELGKHGMTKRDFTEIINFFSKVVVDDTGAMSFVENNANPGC
ncbi:urea amidolyase associated protein UAAP1 [Victivallis sp.]|uniref:urea amidolyase associated protein UAAP1 n=1 Tax=Victivallis sp. TaxID=2049020 RepID=UPI003A901B30